ncbi:chemotaxis protein CheW, partial [Burkholderia sp. Ax-1720]|uniref:chemotaxis protein CheW n=1 Tax=Burkholderia sp. Ax-1720 TaxID=2608335 RepID=UPI001F03964F
MLFLLFELEGARYALDAADIAEVLPLAAAKPIPGAPAWVAGIVIHRGVPVPVIDVSRLALGRAAAPRRSARTIRCSTRSRHTACSKRATEPRPGCAPARWNTKRRETP